MKIRKLNAQGFTHHAMMLGLVVVVGVAIFGSYQVVKSHADPLSSAQTASAGAGTAAVKQSITTPPIKTVKKDCKLYNRVQKGNDCAACLTGFVDVTGAPTTGTCVKKVTCVTHQIYQTSKNTCVCAPSYSLNAATKKCVLAGDTTTKTPAPTPKSTGGTIGTTTPATAALDCPDAKSNGKTCVATADNVKLYCADKGRPYATSTNSCSTTVCLTGYTLNSAKVCQPATAAGIATAQAICAKVHYRYDSAAKACSTSCIVNYSKVNGACQAIAVTQSTMSQNLCLVLGRKWDTAQKNCTVTCLQASSTDVVTFTKGTTDANSYCASTNSSGTYGISKLNASDCSDSHRIYITTIPGCSARCIATYHLVNGLCVPVTGSTAPASTTPPPHDTVIVPPTLTNHGHDSAQTVDHNMTQNNCRLLGRSWITAKDLAKGQTKAETGCSEQECMNAKLQVLKRNGQEYCAGYVAFGIDQAKCQDLHRVWLAGVKGCASFPTQTGVQKKKGALQCAKGYDVYVFHGNKDQGNGYDECLTATTFQQLSSTAKKIGKPVAVVASWSKSQVCKAQGLVLRDGKCKHKIVPQTTNPGASTSPNDTGSTDDTSSTPTGTETSCAKLHRDGTYPNCGGCSKGYPVREPVPDPGYDYCAKQTPDTKCPDGTLVISHGNPAAACAKHGTSAGNAGAASGTTTSQNITVGCDQFISETHTTKYGCPVSVYCSGSFPTLHSGAQVKVGTITYVTLDPICSAT